MAREDDVLFCKIAIMNGMVSQEQAQKCLNFCERREQEGKRRPMVGAVFTKYNLLRPEQVQQLYSAVNKRLGRAAGPAQVLAPPRDRKRAKGRAKAARKQPAKKVDPNTLWKGIGGGVVFIIVIVVIVVMYIQRGSRTEDEGKKSGEVTSAESSAGTSTPGAGTSEKGVGGEASIPAEKKAPEEIDPVFKGDHIRMMGEARRTAFIDGNYPSALGVLTKLREQHADFYKMYPEQLQELNNLEKEIRAMMQGDEPTEEDGGLEDMSVDDL